MDHHQLDGQHDVEHFHATNLNTDTAAADVYHARKSCTAKAIESLLQWSSTQSHILSGGGRSSELYHAPHFPFCEKELPHFHIARRSTREAFTTWRSKGAKFGATIAGAWQRPLFVGGWSHSDAASESGELTFNLQTPSIFLDIRVPKTGNKLLGHHRGFQSMTDFELRLFARRHAFAGYTRVEPIQSSRSCDEIQNSDGVSGFVATRHHAIDWNYVGQPRPRPNKWRVEMGPGGDVWKEWGFARDEWGQHVYMERWERMADSKGPFFALRRRTEGPGCMLADAFLVICGDHFGLVVDRWPPLSDTCSDGDGSGGLVGLIDAALARGRRRKAEELLSLEASHGRISGDATRSPWTIEHSIHPWLEGRNPLSGARLVIAEDGRSLRWYSVPKFCQAAEYNAIIPGSSVSTAVSSPRTRQCPDVNTDSDGCLDAVDATRRTLAQDVRWTGQSLDGDWDLVEGVLIDNKDGDASALEKLFATSGAVVPRESFHDVGGAGNARPRL